MSTYQPRLADNELGMLLEISGGVSIVGPRACGKTSTARQAAGSWADLSPSSPDYSLAQLSLSEVIKGQAPRLIDEWQTVPEVWDGVRRSIDERGAKGQFILTGSAWPEDDARRHSGAGRITQLTMRTMSLLESGHSSGQVSLEKLFSGAQDGGAESEDDIRAFINRIVTGGWPGHGDVSDKAALRLNRSYLESLGNKEFTFLSGSRRNPLHFEAFMRAYAALIAQPASLKSIERRINEDSAVTTGDRLVYDVHEFAQRLFVVEDQPAWSPQVRSRSAALATPKRHLADPSLACAALNLDTDRLLADPETLGLLLESQVVHDLRCYAQANDYRGVFHYRDQKARAEIDVVVERHDGSWAGFEVKLGLSAVEAAAENLLKTAADMVRPPEFLAVVVPNGKAVRMDNGVWLIPLSLLGP